MQKTVVSEDDIAQLNKPPCSLEAEQAVIGSLLLRPEAWDEVYNVVRKQHFYYRQNAVLFEVIGQLYEREITPDVLTVGEELERRNLEDVSGGFAYVAEIAKNTPSAVNIKAYADIVKERAVYRNLISISYEVADECYAGNKTTAEIIEVAESKIVDVAESTIREGGPVHADEALKGAVDLLEKRFQDGDEVPGLSTGFELLDKKTAGLQDSDMIVVAGRPSMGKTAFAMCITENVIVNSSYEDGDGGILVFSLEMPKESLMNRMISSIGKIPLERIRNGNFLDEDWPKLSVAVGKLSKRPFYIDDTGGLTPTEMRTRARKISRELKGLKLIVVDYLQLMRVPELISNPTAEIGEISKALKNLAKEHGCPVIAISQLNRAVETRTGTGRRPLLSDLRSSGQIEQDADLIMFVHREDYYDQDTDRRGIADIIIGKQRNGPLGDVPLAFLDKYTRFEDLDSFRS